MNGIQGIVDLDWREAGKWEGKNRMTRGRFYQSAVAS